MAIVQVSVGTQLFARLEIPYSCRWVVGSSEDLGIAVYELATIYATLVAIYGLDLYLEQNTSWFNYLKEHLIDPLKQLTSAVFSWTHLAFGASFTFMFTVDKRTSPKIKFRDSI
jgi:hypothetical protein